MKLLQFSSLVIFLKIKALNQAIWIAYTYGSDQTRVHHLPSPKLDIVKQNKMDPKYLHSRLVLNKWIKVMKYFVRPENNETLSHTLTHTIWEINLMFHDIDRNVRYATVQKFGNKRTPLASTRQVVKLTEDSAAREVSAWIMIKCDG